MPRVLLSFGAALLLAGVVSLVVPHTAPAQRRPPGLRSQDPNADYCVASGGQVVNRQPFFNTNGPQSDWLQLMGDQDFCEFTSPTDGSRIHITLETLNSTQPSLAALAYYNKPIATPSQTSANPSSLYCSQLGGTDLFGGVNANGGGWVNKTRTDVVVSACIFPDMSSIDSWGLFYNAAGITRGTDLTKVLKYKP